MLKAIQCSIYIIERERGLRNIYICQKDHTPFVPRILYGIQVQPKHLFIVRHTIIFRSTCSGLQVNIECVCPSNLEPLLMACLKILGWHKSSEILWLIQAVLAYNWFDWRKPCIFNKDLFSCLSSIGQKGREIQTIVVKQSSQKKE